MHSGFEIPGMQRQSAGENTCAPVNLLSINQTHLLDQIQYNNTLPSPTRQLFLDHQHHFLPPHHHRSVGGATSSPAYFPANFKLGLNDICSRNNDERAVEEDAAAANLLPGSEQYELPEDTRHLSLGILHCWQNQKDSPIKQPRFWEPLTAEVSNENSEIVEGEQEHLKILHQNYKKKLILQRVKRVVKR